MSTAIATGRVQIFVTTGTPRTSGWIPDVAFEPSDRASDPPELSAIQGRPERSHLRLVPTSMRETESGPAPDVSIDQGPEPPVDQLSAAPVEGAG